MSTPDTYHVEVLPDTFATANLRHTACPVCGGHEYQPRFRLPDFSKSIVACVECGTAQVNPLPDEEELRSYYPTAYYGSEGQKFESLIERFLKVVSSRQASMIARAIPDGGSVLDIGCGRGMLLERLADQGCEVHGTELSKDAAVGADERIDLHVCPTLQAAGFDDNRFDAVVIWHVLEHLSDPRRTIDEIQRVLRPGGKLFVAVPNFGSLQARLFGHAWFHLDPPRHLYHFTASGLRRLLEDCGFALSSSHHFSLRQNPFGWVQSALNLVPGTVRNGLYSDLHNLSETSGSGRWQKLAYYLGMPVAVIVSACMAVIRSGATPALRRDEASGPTDPRTPYTTSRSRTSGNKSTRRSRDNELNVNQESESKPAEAEASRKPLISLLFLLVVTACLYSRAVGFGTVNLDDVSYVVETDIVNQGLSVEGFKWAFTTNKLANWHPLVWLSLMTDATIFGDWYGGFHLTNLLLHLANIVLVWFTLSRMKLPQTAILVATGLFALHPVHVESVVWISERKDVLFGFFGWLSLFFYVGYTQSRRNRDYWFAFVAFALCMLSKQMLVTFPALLLTLDLLVLRPEGVNKPTSSIGRMLADKIPFAVVAAAAVLTVINAQEQAIAAADTHPVSQRVQQAVVNYASYLKLIAVPTDLSILYPLPVEPPSPRIVGLCGLLLITITIVAVSFWRRQKWVTAGWLWFLGTMVPVIGLIQVGGQSIADRYAYFPFVGLYVIAGLAIDRVFDSEQRAALGRGVLVVLGLVLCGLTWNQIGYWQSSVDLWKQADASVERNFVTSYQLGRSHFEAKNYEAAHEPLERAVQFAKEFPKDIRPNYLAAAHNYLGIMSYKGGQYPAAEAHMQESIALWNDGNSSAYSILGFIAYGKGQHKTAVDQLSIASTLSPADPQVWYILALAHLNLQDLKTGVSCLQKALQADPSHRESLLLLQRLRQAQN